MLGVRQLRLILRYIISHHTGNTDAGLKCLRTIEISLKWWNACTKLQVDRFYAGSTFSRPRHLFVCHFQISLLPSVLWHCWFGGRKGIRPVKNGGWWRWALVSPDGVVPSQMVGVSASVNLPSHHNSRSSLLAPAHLGDPRRAVKWLWWWWFQVYYPQRS